MTISTSFAQRRLWFLERLLPGSVRYNNVPVVLRLTGPLDVDALIWSLDQIVARHDVLRASFPDGDVRVEPELRLEVPVEGAGPSELREAIEREVWRPFGMGEWPLVRARLLRLGPDDHVLALTLHHAVFDGWSEDVLFGDLSRFYAAAVLGAPPPAPLAVQYGDFATAQREEEAAGRLDRDLEFWRRRLAGAPSVIELPADRQRPSESSFRGAAQRSFLPGPLWESALAASRGWRATPFMTLLAAFAALLARYCGSTDLVVGTPVAGRTAPEWEPLIGLFMTTLPLRLDVSGNPTLGELAGRVRAAVLEASDHQATPLERVVEAVRPERSLSHNPLFQVLFSCAPGPRPLPRLPAVRVRPIDPGSRTAKFDLSFAVEPRERGAAAMLEYACDLFDRATAARMSRHYRRLLAGALARPDARLDSLPLLGDEERRQVAAWGVSEPLPEAARATPAGLVLERARRTPDAPALRCGEERLTYAELVTRVEDMAGALVERGVGPEVRVGILLERSAEMVVAMLAVLEAGGAYVPIDPAYPRQRVLLMLADAGVSVLLTDREVDGLPGGVGLVLGPRVRAVAGPPPPRGGRDVGGRGVADNLAYVVYTSGSTGQPKGVAITRGNLASFLRALRAALDLPAGMRWSCQSSISFDGVLEETLLPLVTGGEVVLYDEPARRDPDELARRFELDAITAVHCSPSLARVLADLGWPRAPGVTVMVGGEPLPPPLAATLRERGVTLWNVYGPTETTVLSNVDRVGDAAISLGGPLANNRQHVLDRWLQPVPVGVTGELCISGEGVARGYLDRPDLTAAQFVPDPFATVPGQRLYRSGDLARYRADGTLDIRGRRDHQVKVRGFRIELGEIEAALVDQPEVAAAVVVVHERTQIVAYVATEPEQMEDDVPLHPDPPPQGGRELGAELRHRLRERLPEYMVPALVVPLPALPLTSNAKVDRAALPRPEAVQPSAESAPRTAHEETISAIWRSALGLPEVGLDDNFFDVGGHSLLLVSVRDELARAFATDVPLTVLFLRPTVRALAEHFAAGAVEAVALEGSRSRGEARREAAAARAERARVRP